MEETIVSKLDKIEYLNTQELRQLLHDSLSIPLESVDYELWNKHIPDPDLLYQKIGHLYPITSPPELSSSPPSENLNLYKNILTFSNQLVTLTHAILVILHKLYDSLNHPPMVGRYRRCQKFIWFEARRQIWLAGPVTIRHYSSFWDTMDPPKGDRCGMPMHADNESILKRVQSGLFREAQGKLMLATLYLFYHEIRDFLCGSVADLCVHVPLEEIEEGLKRYPGFDPPEWRLSAEEITFKSQRLRLFPFLAGMRAPSVEQSIWRYFQE
ncbi:hypothetical protein BJ508DRAFT_327835 [Ascobolus immersus RN42]|uniref:Uncharacterized protein n=1 Tax=Ascobolus immersus RN42 TaxID=1160509 RepID=A0A3N4I7B6_ASCIM|nr:hypothetical protein BJ508DRAFT_327835 [Ascobolus immersus RN42]